MERNPYQPWRHASWRQRFEIVLTGTVASAIALGMFIGFLFLVGSADDAFS